VLQWVVVCCCSGLMQYVVAVRVAVCCSAGAICSHPAHQTKERLFGVSIRYMCCIEVLQCVVALCCCSVLHCECVKVILCTIQSAVTSP